MTAHYTDAARHLVLIGLAEIPELAGDVKASTFTRSDVARGKGPRFATFSAMRPFDKAPGCAVGPAPDRSSEVLPSRRGMVCREIRRRGDPLMKQTPREGRS